MRWWFRFSVDCHDCESQSSSYLIFLVKKPNFGFVNAGSNWSNLAATGGSSSKAMSRYSSYKKLQVLGVFCRCQIKYTTNHCIGRKFKWNRLLQYKLFPFNPIQRSWIKGCVRSNSKTMKQWLQSGGKGICDGRRWVVMGGGSGKVKERAERNKRGVWKSTQT